MAEFEIRTAKTEDLPVILAIYAHARVFMREHDNPRQWNTAWPPEALLVEDIALKRLHVCEYEGRVIAVFMYIQGVDIDPTYLNIEDGDWMDPSEYGAVHRLASDGTVKGAGSACLSWAYEQCHHLRVDTHGDNYVMQNGLMKNGFTRCGTIYVVEDNDPRIAYEKSPVTLAAKQ